jgi:hypothetical protein
VIINPTLPYGFVTFCDDIRLEIGGKKTLVGVYDSGMTLIGSAPLRVPRLQAIVVLRTELMRLPLTGCVAIKHSISDRVLVSTDFNITEFPATTAAPIENNEIDPVGFYQQWWGFELSDIVIDQPCRIKVRAYIGGDEIRLGALNIDFAPNDAEQAA